MKQLLVFLLIAFGVTTVSSQVLTSAMGASPEEIVKRFVKLDVGGERVTPEGWQKADALFIQPSKPPTDFKIVVMASDYAVSEDPLAGKPGEVFPGYEELGEVGSSLRFELAPSRVETKIFESYVAVQIAKPPKARGIARIHPWNGVSKALNPN